MNKEYADILTSNVIMNVKDEMHNTEDVNVINKLYRQARIWVRFQVYYANALTPDEGHTINKSLKSIRRDRLDKLDGCVL